MDTNVFIPTEKKFREILNETVDSLLENRIPQIIRRANRKEFITTSELRELTGMSFRMQKYHREEGHLQYSQSGRKIYYRTVDVEQFMQNHRISIKDESIKKTNP